MNIEKIKKNTEIKKYIENADEYLKALNYTEHSYPHVLRTATVAKEILLQLGYDKHDAELAEIAGYMHDIGNLVNRIGHAQSGAIMAFKILTDLGLDTNDVIKITTAIGNHDEETAFPNNHITAALILADKADVRRSRVRNTNDPSNFDIHDRVNYSVQRSSINVDVNEGTIELNLTIDSTYCPILDYFEIFLERMNLCKKASKALKMQFKLIINDLCLL